MSKILESARGSQSVACASTYYVQIHIHMQSAFVISVYLQLYAAMYCIMSR
jgi:hypothetical protein